VVRAGQARADAYKNDAGNAAVAAEFLKHSTVGILLKFPTGILISVYLFFS
jgi:hypothetical protein